MKYLILSISLLAGFATLRAEAQYFYAEPVPAEAAVVPPGLVVRGQIKPAKRAKAYKKITKAAAKSARKRARHTQIESSLPPSSAEGVITITADSLRGSRTGPWQQYAREDVIAAQVMLARNGFNPGPPDGVLGRRTVSALEGFRAKYDIREPDLLGAETLAALHSQGTNAVFGPPASLSYRPAEAQAPEFDPLSSEPMPVSADPFFHKRKS